MIKAIIVFGSTTGNTEKVTQSIEKGVKETGMQVDRVSAAEIAPKQLLEYDWYLLGCSTWGDGELQDDFIGFELKMQTFDFAGKKAAIFGTGDSIYSQFCKANEIIGNTFKKQGGTIIGEELKIDGDISDDVLTEAKAWGVKMARAFEGSQS